MTSSSPDTVTLAGLLKQAMAILLEAAAPNWSMDCLTVVAGAPTAIMAPALPLLSFLRSLVNRPRWYATVMASSNEMALAQ